MENYAKEVKRFYEAKKTSGELSPNLTNLTPASLRDECVLAFKAGCNDSDLRTLRTFLERPHNEELTVGTIRKVEIIKFKPLINYLRNKTIVTADKNIELLASLCGFNPRPSARYWRTYCRYGGDMTIPATSGEQTADIKSQEVSSTPTDIAATSDAAPQLLAGNSGVNANGGNLKRILLSIATFCQDILKPKGGFSKTGVAHFESDLWVVEEKKAARQHGWSKVRATKPSKIVLEYPSGVRLMVENVDVTIISQLLKL